MTKTIMMTVTLQHDDSDDADDTSPLLFGDGDDDGPGKRTDTFEFTGLLRQIPVMVFSFQ